jgi:hypothetical protein
MTALEQFLAQCERTIEFAAFAAAHQPDCETEHKLARLARNLTAGWRQVAPRSLLSDADLASAVADVIERIRARKREIEVAPSGRA